jgi:hypothetical protein
MSENDKPLTWITFAPVSPHWVAPQDIPLPFEFFEGITYQVFPEWIWQDSDSDDLRSELRKLTDDDVHHCIVIEYKASELGKEQQLATYKLFRTHLALWLAQPTPLSIEKMVHAEKYGAEWLTRHIVSYDGVRPLGEYQGQEFSLDDFSQAKTLLPKLLSLPKGGTVHTALSAVTRARIEGSWEIRFLLYWLAMESLFGPVDGREIAFRLSQRAALFLERGATAQEIFNQINKSYGWRSKIVHGLRVSKLKDGEPEKLLRESEELLRRIFLLIFNAPTTAETFDGNDREKFLDGLAFSPQA